MDVLLVQRVSLYHIRFLHPNANNPSVSRQPPRIHEIGDHLSEGTEYPQREQLASAIADEEPPDFHQNPRDLTSNLFPDFVRLGLDRRLQTRVVTIGRGLVEDDLFTSGHAHMHVATDADGQSLVHGPTTYVCPRRPHPDEHAGAEREEKGWHQEEEREADHEELEGHGKECSDCDGNDEEVEEEEEWDEGEDELYADEELQGMLAWL